MPALILTLYALPLATGAGYDSTWGGLLANAAYVWGYQHIGMQNYGILQIYRLRSGSDAAAPSYEKAIFYAIIVAVAARNHLAPLLEYAGLDALAASTQGAVDGGLGAVLLLLCLAYFAHLRSSSAFSGPAFLYFAVSLVAMIQWPFYDDLPEGSWFLVFNGHHSVAYLGLLFLMDWNRRAPGDAMTFGEAFKRYLRFFAPLVAASLALVGVVALYGSARALAGYSEQGGSLEVLLGFFVMHYYVESMVWRFRHAHNREHTLPLLHPPGRER